MITIRHIHKEATKIITWSGGTSTELFISPEGSLYQERNFKIRISTATVELPESTFTLLPGFTRVLMILNGELELEQEHKKISLRKFETYTFDGGIATKSFGTAQDFNLMLRQGIYGHLEGVYWNTGTVNDLVFDNESNLLVVYLYKGKLEVGTKEKKRLIQQGDLLVLSLNEKSLIPKVHVIEAAEVVICHIAE